MLPSLTSCTIALICHVSPSATTHLRTMGSKRYTHVGNSKSIHPYNSLEAVLLTAAKWAVITVLVFVFSRYL
ncbi:hypothetical protein BJ166DRAFT_539628, partial [Pestalotiopsis sp. NC0098]